jgi:hypothetical protein
MALKASRFLAHVERSGCRLLQPDRSDHDPWLTRAATSGRFRGSRTAVTTRRAVGSSTGVAAAGR